MTPRYGVSRRTFLARVGLLGAAAGTVGATRLLPTSSSPASVTAAGSALGGPLDGLLGLLRPLLDELSRDTLNGLTAFVVPGPDAYSRAQGTPRSEPGALDAKATDFLIESLDNFVPFPQELARPIAAAMATGLSDLGIELPLNLGGLLPIQVEALDDALEALLQSDEAIPLSLAVALLLNLVATQVNPAAVSGPFLAPFARLTFDEKAAAFALIEGADADLVGLLDTQFPEPLHDSVSGLLRFVGGALLEFPAFGSYNEWAVFDTRTRTLRGTPVGWRLTGYGGASDGWPELLGYYQGRTAVGGA